MSLRTAGSAVHSGSVGVVLALAFGIGGGAFSLGYSAVAVSLLGAATTAVGCWAFISEP